MKQYRGSLFILCLLIFILSIGTISANDTVDNTNLTLVDSNQEMDSISLVGQGPNSVGVSENGNWADIKSQIESAATGDKIYLNGLTYKTTGYYDTINIKTDLTIIGGTEDNPNLKATFDGSGRLRIFSITSTYKVTISNVIFKNGYHMDYGGAIYGPNTIDLTLINTTFDNNRAPKGGAIYMGSTFHLTVINSTFSNNLGTNEGGAIHGTSSRSTIINSTFISNRANNAGGAIFATSNSNMDISNTIFKENAAKYGGAIYTTYVFNGNVINSSFIANTNSAICNKDTVDLTILKSKFISNIADQRSVIAAGKDSKLKISNSLFEENVIDGTVIKDVHLISVGSDSELNIVSSTFKNNKLNGTRGGHIYASSSKVSISDSTFINNTANTFGTVISAENLKELNILNSTFINSTSTEDAGAAIYAKYCPIFTVTDSRFIGGTARFGGAICSLSSKLTVKNSNFTSNRALFDGGAIYSMYEYLDIIGIFTNNTAINGGAIFADSTPNIIIKNSKFIKNKASNYGGAWFFNAYTTVTKENNVFTDNSARVDKDTHLQKNYDYIIGNNDYILIKGDYSDIGNLPSRYDDREQKLVSPVGNQDKAGVCWAFAAVATLESCIMKATGNKNVVLSEANMKNLAEKFSAYGWATESNDGNVHVAALGYLASWLGPVNESQDKFSDRNVLSPALNSSYHIQNILFIDRPTHFTDNSAIKEAVMKYGAVSTSYCHSESSYNKNTYGYYYNGADLPNHAITIVGWDDNYSKNKFNNVAPGDGAYIIKNSWGSQWGEMGYFYISYYDTSIFPKHFLNPTYTFILNETQRFNRNYQYDIAGIADIFEVPGVFRTVTCENIFTSTTNDFLAGVSTYFLGKYNYTVNIYVNNDLKLSQEGSANHVGYETINLNKYVPIKVGDVFKVSLILKSNVGGLLVPISGDTISQYLSSVSRTIAGPGVSYLKTNTGSADAYYGFDNKPGKYVICLKAFTATADTSIEIDENIDLNNIKISASVKDKFGNPVSNGVVEFNVNGKTYLVDVNDGVATLTGIPNNLKRYDIKATFVNSSYYHSSSDTFVLANDKDTYLSISAKNVNSTEDLVLEFTFTDKNNAGIDAPLRVKFNNVEYTVQTTGGKGSLPIPNDFAPGECTVEAFFDGNGQYDKTSASLTFTKGKYAASIAIEDILVDGQNVVITFSTNFNDQVSAYVDGSPATVSGNKIHLSGLGAGTHGFSIEFAGNDHYNSTKLMDEFTIEEIRYGTIEGQDVTMIHTEGKTFSVTVKDENGNPLANAVVTFQFNDGSSPFQVTTDNKGIASFVINKSPKTYEIASSFVDKGKKIETSNRIVVSLNAYRVIVPDLNMYQGDGSQLTATVLDSLNRPVKDVSVGFSFAKESKVYYRTTNEKGEAYISINRNPGTYSMIASIQQGGKTIQDTSKVTIRQGQWTITGSNMDVIQGTPAVFKVTVKDASGKPVKGVTVSFNFAKESRVYTRTTDANGVASISISRNVGTYSMVSSVQQNGNTIKTTNTIRISSASMKIISESATYIYGNKAVFKVTVKKANGAPASGVRVGFQFVGESKVYYRTTNSEGIASVDINRNPNTYTMVSFITDNGKKIESRNTITITKNSQYNVVANDLSMKYGDGSSFKIVVKNSLTNKPLKDIKIGFSFSGESRVYYRTTDSTGTASIGIARPVGTYTIVMTLPDGTKTTKQIKISR